jgi:uncharacterized protein YgiM (DUF1202 family)
MEYDDEVKFCAKDGRSLMAKSTTRTRLCPYCANSIEEDATNCPYCKADLLSQTAPQWLKRDERPSESRFASDNKRSSIPPKFIWMAAMLIIALAAFFVGGYIQRNQLLASSQGNLKELKAKDQMIQSSETQIQTLQSQLAQARQELTESSNQLAAVKTKLEESQKNLSVTQQRLGIATHEIDRLSASRSQVSSRTVSRPPEPLPPQSANRTASRPVEPLPPSSPSPSARRSVETGVYETTRATTVYEDPSPSSRVISQINKGTRINVVSSAGDWLEVRSRRGNPPGYVRADDARYVGRSN